ncbi:MAG: ABC transporter permease [Bilifractor sp.]
MEQMQRKIGRRKSLARRLSENKKVQAVATVILPLLLGVLIFALWQGQVLQAMFHTDTFTLPVPTRIASLMQDNMGKVLVNTRDTVVVALIGLIAGSLLGYGAAILASMFPNMGKGGLSIVGAFASIPVVALAPVMNNWTRSVSSTASTRSMVAKILVVMLIAAADMGLNAYRGLTELKPFAKDLMATYAAPKRLVFLKLQLPNSVPYIFTALKVSVPASIMTAIVSEYFAEYITGVGRQIRENIVLAQYATAWVYITAACVIGLIAYVILMAVQALVMRRYH